MVLLVLGRASGVCLGAFGSYYGCFQVYRIPQRKVGKHAGYQDRGFVDASCGKNNEKQYPGEVNRRIFYSLVF